MAAAIRSANGSPKRTPSPPPMITASTSRRLTAEAMPAPSASTAPSMRSLATLSPPSSAWAHTALVRRVRPRSSTRLKQTGLPPPSGPLASRTLHRRPPRVCLHTSPATTPASSAPELDHGVADLASGAPAQPHLALKDQASSDSGPPEHSQHRAVGTTGAEMELRLSGHPDIVAHCNRDPQRLAQCLAQR